MRDPGKMAIISSGNPEKDRLDLERHAKQSDLIDAGMCPNGCGGMIEDDTHNAHCPKCAFQYFSSGGLDFKPEASA